VIRVVFHSSFLAWPEISAALFSSWPTSQAYQILKNYGIPVPKFGIASTEEQVIECSNSIGYPVVLKLISAEISHKSDVDEVILDLRSIRKSFYRRSLMSLWG
jgi:acyl-CoA synthetase (NDP forming)